MGEAIVSDRMAHERFTTEGAAELRVDAFALAIRVEKNQHSCQAALLGQHFCVTRLQAHEKNDEYEAPCVT